MLRARALLAALALLAARSADVPRSVLAAQPERPEHSAHSTHTFIDSHFKMKSEKLGDSLRKQLMQDNYDYEGNFEAAANLRASSGGEHLPDNRKITAKKKTPSPYTPITNYYLANAKFRSQTKHERTHSTSKHSDKNELITVARKDLLYYVDEDALQGRDNVVPETADRRRPASAKYKLLRNKHKNFRRTGNSQFIQEESKDGVALLKIGAGPFPVLQLDPARRQYMRQRAALASADDELPPPALLTAPEHTTLN